VSDELLRYLPTFVQVAGELSFSSAARRLGVTPAAVSKSVRTLEQGLGIRLFRRSTHALTLTDEGERLRRRVGPLLDAVSESLVQAMNLPDTPRGLLRVSAPYAIGKSQLLPLLPEFRRRYPEVELDLRLEDRVVDLVKEGIDVSLGVRLDPAPGLIAKRLASTRLIVVASPEFLEQHGVPREPADVLRFPCIRYRIAATGRLFPWRFHDPATESSISLDPPASVSVSAQEIGAELAAAHLGLAMLGYISIKPYLEAGSVVEVLGEYALELPPLMLYYTSKRDLPSRTRVFIDFVSEALSDPSAGGAAAARARAPKRPGRHRRSSKR
jgi:DNA-binding transcriptional LysR family regulator